MLSAISLQVYGENNQENTGYAKLKFILVLLKLKPFCLFVTQELETDSIIYSNYYSLTFRKRRAGMYNLPT